MSISAQQLKQIMPQASMARIGLYVAPLNAAMEEYDIRTLKRAAAFIAQLAHESGQFQFMEEIWGPTAAQKRYEPVTSLSRQLGNRQPGDGKRFKGRGPIQITGRANYSRYGELLGVDLAAQPELAAKPELGFRIAGLFWSRNGLNAPADAGDFERVTRRINGGLNGFEDRKHFHAKALAVLGATMPDRPAAVPRSAPANPRSGATPQEDFNRGAEAIHQALGADAAEAPAARGATRDADADDKPSGARAAAGRKRVLDARRDTLDFRDTMYIPTLIEVPTHVPLEDYLAYEVPVLDQGTEGACTGYGLATVANYLLRRRRVVPDADPVSPRMLYDLARRYDEWPGENYSGSSARGAMKGWHKHGVCPEELYRSYPHRPDRKGLTQERTSEARRRPLGAYFRVNHRDIVAMHSAIAEVGVLYATCVVHEGWNAVRPNGSIQLTDQPLGGHAVAIVAYDDEGFWIQNSWGPDWGRAGFARIGYDDWLRNGTDVWVARLGAPVSLYTAESTAHAHAASSGESAAYAYQDLRPHIVSVGNDGRLRAGGDYGVTPEALQHIFEEDIPRVASGWSDTVRVLLYAHGGLVDEASAVQRLADYRPALLGGEIYPLAFIWRTDYWTTLSNILADALRRRRPEGVLDAAKDFMLDRLDDALEPVARALTGRAGWQEMKENALAASKSNHAAWLVAKHLEDMSKKPWLDGRKLEVHLVAHSAGAVLHAGLLQQLQARGLPVQTCTLWAPACTKKLFDDVYRPAIDAKAIGRFDLYVLDDKAEQDDSVARIYNKSLLYLVSHAFEDRFRIPGFQRGEPLLGMQRWLDDATRALFEGGPHRLVVAPNDLPPESGRASRARRHSDFDDDEHTVLSTFKAIRGGTEPKSAAARPLQFHRNGASLRDRRNTLQANSLGGRS